MSEYAPAPAADSSPGITRQRMEQSVDSLAELARTEIEGGEFIAEVLNRFCEVAGAARVRFWRKSLHDQWEVAGERPHPVTTSEQANEDVSLVMETAASQQLSTHPSKINQDGATPSAVRTLCPIVYAGQTVAVLDAWHLLKPTGELPTDVVPFFHAIAEITADFLSQLELRQLRRTHREWQRWDQFTSALIKSKDLSTLAATIVNDGRILAGCDRMTLLQRYGTRYKVLAVSGVSQVEPRANTVRSLEAIAAIAAKQSESSWFNSVSPNPATGAKDPEWLAEHARLTGSHCVGLIPIPLSSSSSDATAVVTNALLTIEQFENQADFPAWRLRAEQLVKRIEAPLLAALERESIPFVHTLQAMKQAPEWIRRPGTVMALVSLLAIVGFLCLVPAEFTVTGQAELVPLQRREVFASSSGIVEELLVAHGDEVVVDQPLVVLHDPQLSLDLPRVVGEIEVVRERLKGILAARLAGSSNVDAANRARQLTSEEEELKERQQSLTRQKQLIELQQQALTLRSPIRGKVLTWDVATTLSARPVERGQALLTIGDTDGPWVIEMHLPDKDFGHVQSAQSKLGSHLEVHFILPSDPFKTYRGTIRDVAETTQWNDQSGSSVLITIAIDKSQLENPRSGMTAISRIRCGKKPIGYVWLHDLIDVIRVRWLL